MKPVGGDSSISCPRILWQRGWTGRRIKPEEVEAQSGIRECASTENFRKDLENSLKNKGFTTVYMGFRKAGSFGSRYGKLPAGRLAEERISLCADPESESLDPSAPHL